MNHRVHSAVQPQPNKLPWGSALQKSPLPPFTKGGREGIFIHSRVPRPQAGHGKFRRNDKPTDVVLFNNVSRIWRLVVQYGIAATNVTAAPFTFILLPQWGERAG